MQPKIELTSRRSFAKGQKTCGYSFPMILSRFDEVVKRGVDVALAVAGLVALSPLMLAIAVVVKFTSRGPVFFRHLRLGKGRRAFRMFKFRTMAQGCSGPEFTVSNDARITHIGSLLRKTKLDELPQLINVVRGEMSLVGPRPQSLSLAEHYPDNDLRTILSVRPGITGPTQLWLRHEEDLLAAQNNPERFYVEDLLPLKIASDRRYVANRNLLTDMRIVTETVRAVAKIAPLQKSERIMDITPFLASREDENRAAA